MGIQRVEVGLRGEERRGRREGRGAASVAAAFLSLLFRRVEHEVEDDLVSLSLFSFSAQRCSDWAKERRRKGHVNNNVSLFFFLYIRQVGVTLARARAQLDWPFFLFNCY